MREADSDQIRGKNGEVAMKKCSAVPYEGEEDYLFISYSHKDSEIVIPILEKLEEAGYRIWFDEGIDPGSEWPETIADHLNRASVCVGFITENYLNSQNCRRELNFALKKQIPFLAIMLEDVKMSLGVEMQLSAYQAIYKYKLPSDEKFFEKFNSTKSIISSRRKADPAPEEKAAPSDPSPESDLGKRDYQTAPEKKPSPKKKEKPKKSQKTAGKKKKLRIFLIIFALVLAVVVIAALKLGNDLMYDFSQKSSRIPVDTVVSREDFLSGESEYSKRIFFGKKVQSYGSQKQFIDHFKSQTVTVNDLQVLAIPYSIEVCPDIAPDIMNLTFVDAFDKQYSFSGKFELKNGELIISPPASKDGDNAKNDQIKETIIFKLKLSANSINLQTGSVSCYYESGVATVSGSASGPLLNEVQAINIPKTSAGKSCSIRFLFDGKEEGRTKNAKVSKVDSEHLLKIEWTKLERFYNGREVTKNEKGDIFLHFESTYPYGCILYYSDEVYFYQEAF